MKYLKHTFLLALAVSFWAFTVTTEKKTAKLTVDMKGCEKIDSIFLLEFDGGIFKAIKTAKKENEGTFVFEMPTTGPRFYYVGLEANNIRPIILGPEKEVAIQGICSGFRNAKIIKSDLNLTYEKTRAEMKQLQNQFNQLAKQRQYNKHRPDEAKRIEQQMATLDQQRLGIIDSLKTANPYMGHVFRLNTYLSYPNNGQDYSNEVEYFAKTYFQFADWKNEDYNYFPWVYESMKSYAITLSSIGMTPGQHQAYLDAILKDIPADSRTYKLAIGGALAGMQQKNHDNYVVYAKKYIEKYKTSDPLSTTQIAKEMSRRAAFSIGGQAPDFTMNDPEGQPQKLSDFKGSVTLIDFWASWCGPCRRENPNVVKMYEKYHEKGFDILSVSLDKDKNRWLAAIEKDSLNWTHVSDLKGWQNEAAKMYGVKSIPETILLDNEGKIIARKLRGATLEAKLKEIFGE